MSRKEIVTSDKFPPAKGPYSPAVRAGDFLFVSGQGPIDPTTGEALLGTIEEQTKLVLSNLRTILEGAGSSLGSVVKTTVYLTNMDNFAAMNGVYASFFPEAPPARTTIQAARLPLGISVEIEAVALVE